LECADIGRSVHAKGEVKSAQDETEESLTAWHDRMATAGLIFATICVVSLTMIPLFCLLVSIWMYLDPGFFG
jgi:hypothetical protein